MAGLGSFCSFGSFGSFCLDSVASTHPTTSTNLCTTSLVPEIMRPTVQTGINFYQNESVNDENTILRSEESSRRLGKPQAAINPGTEELIP